MKHPDGKNWGVHGLLDVENGSLLVYIQSHTGMKYSNGDGGMGIQPWYRLHHTCNGLGLGEGVGDVQLVVERAGSVPKLSKKLSGALSRGTQKWSAYP